MESNQGNASSPRPNTLKRINMRRFLDELRRLGPSTRADLTRVTGVAPPTSSSIIADLLQAGYIETTEGRPSAKGRPGIFFRLASSAVYVLAVTIGNTECTVAPAGLDGKPDWTYARRIATPAHYELLLQQVQDAISELQLAKTGRCLGVGISVPGLVDERTGTIALSSNLPFLTGRSLGPDLEELLGEKVVCLQEDHALCLAEQSIGHAQDLSHFAVIDLTFGLGMGIVSGGKHISGAQGFAGELGHITVEPSGKPCACGNRGCLETVATDAAFLIALRHRLQGDPTENEVFTMVQAGQIDVAEELDRTLDYLAIGLAAVINLFNPQAIFLYGRLLDLSPSALPDLIEKTRRRALGPSGNDCQIRKAEGDKLAGTFTGLIDEVFAAIGPKLA